MLTATFCQEKKKGWQAGTNEGWFYAWLACSGHKFSVGSAASHWPNHLGAWIPACTGPAYTNTNLSIMNKQILCVERPCLSTLQVVHTWTSILFSSVASTFCLIKEPLISEILLSSFKVIGELQHPSLLNHVWLHRSPCSTLLLSVFMAGIIGTVTDTSIVRICCVYPV